MMKSYDTAGTFLHGYPKSLIDGAIRDVESVLKKAGIDSTDLTLRQGLKIAGDISAPCKHSWIKNADKKAPRECKHCGGLQG